MPGLDKLSGGSAQLNPSSTLSGLKRLSMAKSIEELNKKVQDIPFVQLTDKRVINSLVTVFEEANKHLANGDEEKAYIYYMRVAHLYLKVKDKAEDKIFFDIMMGPAKFKKCIETSEELSKSLVRRYQALQESELPLKEQEAKTSASAETNHSLVNNGQEPVAGKAKGAKDGKESDLVTNNLIACIELFELLEECKKSNHEASNPSLLILDSRPSSDFEKSHILLNTLKMSSNSVVIINIPDEALRPGLAMSSLEKSLSTATVAALKKRRSVKKVVIFDWMSSELTRNSNLTALFDALWKWDNSAERCKSPPSILKGGYKEWLMYFPVLCSDPKVAVPEKESPVSPISLSHINYDLDALEEGPPKPRNDMSNGFLSKDEEMKVSLLNNRINNKWPKNAPGTAMLIPSVDRATKPKVEITDPKPNEKKQNTRPDAEEAERYRLKKEREAEEEMRRYRQQKEEEQEEEMVRLKKEADLKDRAMAKLKEENDKLKTFSSSVEKGAEIRPKAESKPTDKAKANRNTVHGITNGTAVVPINGDSPSLSTMRPKNDRTMSESKANVNLLSPLSKSKGLSRSHSSPNIAQLLAEEEEENETEANKLMKSRSSTNPPQFDRTLKPTTLLSDPMTKSLSTSVARSRNFSPVYGIAGQAITGLRNLGNTCFMNAIIQCLTNTIELAVYFNQEKHLQDINKNTKFGSGGELAEELAVLIRQMWTCQYKSLAPKDFKIAVGNHMSVFTGCEQQDSHEFLVMLLDKVNADLNKAPKAFQENGPLQIPDDMPTHLAINKFWSHHVLKNKSIIQDLFEGLLLSTLTCLTCKKTSDSFEVFSCLSLPIPPGGRCNILDCLKLFSEPEKMCGEAAWDCPTCRTKRDAVKKMVVCRLPKVLLIHLKRFSYEGMWRQKLQTFVEFPLQDLNLKNYRYVNTSDPSQQALTYDLYGVVNHYGTLEGGHYIAYSKHAYRSKWYKYDDHEVTELSPADVKSQAAYVLFYTSSTFAS